MPRKVFTPGEVLAAADVNSFLMDQTIMTFAGTAARGSAIGTATEGMYTHLNDTDSLQYWNGSAWVSAIPASSSAILQVVSVTKSDTSLTTSTSFADITGLSANITPTSATSKILVLLSMMFGLSGEIDFQVQLVRDSTAIGIGDSAGSRTRVTLQHQHIGAQSAFFQPTYSINHLDSPATTSALTYKVQANVASGTGYINRSGNDSDDADRGRGISSITLMEVAG
jgi:hypothetical protein